MFEENKSKFNKYRDIALIALLFGNFCRGCDHDHLKTKLDSIERKLDARPIVEQTSDELPRSYEINGQRFYLRTVDDKPTYVLEE